MAEDKLGKVVRIDDRTYDPKGAKLEVWTKGRHKYLIKYLDPKVVSSIDKITYINGDKISASLTDDEVIKGWLAEKEASVKSNTSIQVYKVIQDPYSDSEITKRVYGDGKSPYYLNNGCKIFIEWKGYIPNPKFTLGTFSTATEASKDPATPERFLRNQPITYNKDEVYNLPPFSTWVVPTGEVNASLQPVPNYRDNSSITSKKITIHLPDGFTENGGKGYLILTENDELRYSTDNTAVEDTYKNSSIGDSYIISDMISKFKTAVIKLHGVSDYDLKLCSPDSEACKLIEYKSPLEATNNTPQQSAINDTPPGPSQSSIKIKLSIQGLFDIGDGTTPGNTSSVFEIKAKTNIPAFTVWAGEIPKTEEIDVFEDLPELDPEYIEGRFEGKEEVLVNGVPVASFMSVELMRDEDVTVNNGTGGGVDRGGSNVNTPGGDVSNSSVSLPTDLSNVRNSVIITRQSTGSGTRSITSDITAPSGQVVSGSTITKNMNEFVSDVLGPFATFLKSNYPSLYKSWYITSATRGYIPAGGSLTSQHLKGQAIDSQILGANSSSPGENIKLLNAILTWYKSNPVGYGQILFETRGNSCWIHWSYSRGNTRLQLLRFKSDSTLRSASVNTTGSYVEPTVTSSSLGF